MQPLKVNFTDQEATSTVREIPPSGTYTVNITKGELKEVKPGRKNTGKPYWQLTFVVQEGPYTGTTLIASIMLFDTALYSLAQLMKALGYSINEGDFTLPSIDDIVGKTVLVRGLKQPPKTMPDGQELSERFEIKGYKAAPTGGASADAHSSILP